jgi:hypothetical protein
LLMRLISGSSSLKGALAIKRYVCNGSSSTVRQESYARRISFLVHGFITRTCVLMVLCMWLHREHVEQMIKCPYMGEMCFSGTPPVASSALTRVQTNLWYCLNRNALGARKTPSFKWWDRLLVDNKQFLFSTASPHSMCEKLALSYAFCEWIQPGRMTQ